MSGHSRNARVIPDPARTTTCIGAAPAEGCDNTTKYGKIQGGIQIMWSSGSSQFQGTLGCIVNRRRDRSRENVYLLTNKHVLYSGGDGAGEVVYHPTPKDDPLGPTQSGGQYGNYQYPPDDPAAPVYFVDAAIARVDLDSKCCGSTCTKDTTEVEPTNIVDLQINSSNAMTDVRSVINDVTILYTPQNPVKVFKVGRTTGKTTGRVVAVNAPLDADPPPDRPQDPRFAAQNTIEIEFDVSSTPNGNNCHGIPRFTEEGDSGSVVLDEQGRVIGLHTHRGKVRPDGLTPSHACHILPVLEQLSICIPTTTGTSHGSSGATDGSGIASPPMGDFELPDGQIAFTGAPALTQRSLPDPAPLSDAEFRHMRGLLDAVRSSARGRELHDLFGQLRREIGYLVRNSRPVLVVWHRNKGPAFLAHVLNHLKGHTDRVPCEADGVSAVTLLTRLAPVLKAHGSLPLGRAIDEHLDELLHVLSDKSTISAQDLIAELEPSNPTRR